MRSARKDTRYERRQACQGRFDVLIDLQLSGIELLVPGIELLVLAVRLLLRLQVAIHADQHGSKAPEDLLVLAEALVIFIRHKATFETTGVA